MNFKKVLSIASVASLAVVGLASCGGSKKKAEEYTGNVNVAASYKNIGYITYGRGTNSLAASYTTVDGRVLNANESLTPVWQDIATNMNVTIKDAAPTAADTATMEQDVITQGYKGNNGLSVDVLETSQGDSYNQEIANGNLLNLLPYIQDGTLKNLKAWLLDHQTVYKQMIADEGGENEGIYFTPYFDGLDQNEQQLNMNIDMVKALLDEEAEQTTTSKEYYDLAKAGLDTDVKYTTFNYNKPFISSMSNQKITVAKQTQTGLDTKGETRIDDNDRTAYTTASYEKADIVVNIAAGQTITEKFNALATAGKGTGKDMVETLKAYIDATYGKYIGEGKLYAHRSDLFISTSAAYNTDELIALLQCIEANPGFLTGNKSTDMIPFFPRTGEKNRVRRLISFMQIFGARGLEGEKDRYWINADGKLTDGRTQEYLLHCLTLMNQLQKDGLFPSGDHWALPAGEKGDYRDVALSGGYAFMCNDMANVAAFNNETTGKGKCYNITGVLPPVSKWGFTYNDGSNKSTGDNAKLSSAQDAGFSYTRFSEDDRTMKSGGWVIVKSAVEGNKAKLKKILKIFDYMYSAEGSVLECFGYNAQASEDQKSKAFVKRSAGETAVNAGYNFDKEDDYLATDASGNYYVNIKQDYKDEMVATCKGTWHNYMTQYWGACLGIGNIRTNYLESQLTGNMQKVGVTKLGNAQAVGAYFLATTTGSNFLQAVKTQLVFTPTQIEENKATDAVDLISFWTEATASPFYTVVEKGWAANTTYNSPATVTAKYSGYNSTVLKNAAVQWNFTADSTDQYTFMNYKA